MNDRELLELAAKAAGITVHGLADKFVAQHNLGKDALCVANDRGGDSLWNPLTNDNNALRLAVKLRMTIITLSDSIEVNSYDSLHCEQEMTNEGQDPYAATRLAIVRAAAEIGKAIP